MVHTGTMWCFMCTDRCFTCSCEAPVVDVSHGIHGQVEHVGGPASGYFTWCCGRCLTLVCRWAVFFCGSQGQMFGVTLMVSSGSSGQVSRHGPSMPGVVRDSSVLGSTAGNPAICR